MTTNETHNPFPVSGTPPLQVEWLRLQRGVTRIAVARAAGLDRAYLYRVERSRLWPSPEVVLRLAAALGVDPEVLVRALLRSWLIKHGIDQPEEGQSATGIR
jgi:transcriptional regulator with XRE-family HTH domain